MNLSEVLKQIAPCNIQEPYIFISYSSHDKELVWQDALEFQNRGYNIWLDEKNIDKTKASWKEDALLAIEDMYCLLVVFYVSKSSLISEACYNELAKTTDELSVALHDGPIKFIAIDVDEIGNIGEFTGNLHQSVFKNPTLSKEEKSKQLLTLHHFKKEFFDSNNERVRVHPKNESNRKMNYYEEIVAAFPDLTCNGTKKNSDAKEENIKKQQEEAEKLRIEAEEKFRAETEARIQAEIAARSKAENEAKIWKENFERMQLEAFQKKQQEEEAFLEKLKEEKFQEEFLLKRNARIVLLSVLQEISKKKAASTPVQNVVVRSQNGFSREQITVAIAKANSNPELKEWNKILTVLDAGEKKLMNALHSYAKTVAKSDIIGLLDTTVFGSAKEGFLITHRGLYSDNFNKGQYIEFKRLQNVQKGRKTYCLEIIYTDGTIEEFFVPTGRQTIITTFLTSLLSQA